MLHNRHDNDDMWHILSKLNAAAAAAAAAETVLVVLARLCKGLLALLRFGSPFFLWPDLGLDRIVERII